MSSSESDIEPGESACYGYQFEPEYTEEELINKHEKVTEKGDGKRHNTITVDSFCTCGHCNVLEKERECLCCQQFQHYVETYISEDIQCITMQQDFDLICLNNVVLETAYVSFMRYKSIGGRAPDTLTPRQSRLMAYRQFLCWVRRGQPLGRKNRVVLPACAVVKIRKAFPEESGRYEGFHSESDSISSMSDSDSS